MQPSAKRPMQRGISPSGGQQQQQLLLLHHQHQQRQQQQQQLLRSPPRKIVIQAFTAPRLPETFETETWGKLRAAIEAIYERHVVNESLEELYRGVETLCTHDRAPRLYELCRAEVDKWVARDVAVLAGSCATSAATEDDAVLAAAHTCWTRHCANVLLIRNIFLTLDRTYALQQQRPLWDTALASLRTHVAAHPAAGSRIVRALLALVARDRHGDAVDRALAASVTKFLAAVGLYDDPFEPELAAEAVEVYRTWSSTLMATENVAQFMPEYLRLVERRLREEAERTELYLLPRSRKLLVGAVEREMLAEHLQALLGSGLAALLFASDAEQPQQQQQDEHLARLHSLCTRIGAGAELRKAFQDHVRAAGHAIVSDVQRDKSMVAELLALKARLDRIVAGPFGPSAQLFGQALRDAFTAFINERSGKPAELLAKFADRQLRTSKPILTTVSVPPSSSSAPPSSVATGAIGPEETDVEAVLDGVVALFRMVEGKDVFEAFYKKHLAKRLLLGRSASNDAERAMVAKLKAECGPSFTGKLEGMFKDMDVSREVMAAFKQQQQQQQAGSGDAVAAPSIDLNVHVLTSAYWPAFPNLALTLPPELASLQQNFAAFYTKKHGSRKISWQNSLGSVVLRAAFPKGRKELQVTLPQTVVLHAFNNTSGALTIADLQTTTGIEEKELRVLLQSLSGKLRLLVKDASIPGEAFAVNDAFTSKFFRIKVPMSRPKEEAAAEDKKTEEDVAIDRQYQIDAAIVRIMKTRKHISHAQLMSELFAQLKFPLKAADAKARIESLMEREYMERSKDDPQSYDYLA